MLSPITNLDAAAIALAHQPCLLQSPVVGLEARFCIDSQTWRKCGCTGWQNKNFRPVLETMSAVLSGVL